MQKIFFGAIFFTILLSTLFTFANIQAAEQPKNIDEAVNTSEQILNTTQKEMPGFFEKAWQNEVLPVWQKMLNWAKVHLWTNIFGSRLEGLWQNSKNIIQEEVDQRKTIVKDDFQKEKDELKNEAPQVDQSLWEKIKELIK
jgi:hypothetical protein